MAAIEQFDRTHFDARRFHVDEDEADAFLRLGGGWVGSAKEEAPVSELRERRPGLLAVDDPFIAIANSRGFHAGEVRTGARLGIALAPPHITGKDTGKVFLFLLFGTECVDHRRNHRHAERKRHDGVDAGILFRPDVTLSRGPACATIFLRPGGCRPALLAENFVPGEELLACQVFARTDSCEFLGIIFVDEGAYFIPKGDFLWGKFKVHGGQLLRAIFEWGDLDTLCQSNMARGKVTRT